MQGACVCATTSGCRCHTEPKKSCTLIARPNQCCSSPSPLLSRTLPGTCVCTPPSVASVCPRGTKVIACLCSSPSQPHSHISRVGLAAAAKSHLVCTARVIQLQRPEAGAIVLVPVKSEAAWNATSPLVVLLCGNAVRTNAGLLRDSWAAPLLSRTLTWNKLSPCCDACRQGHLHNGSICTRHCEATFREKPVRRGAQMQLLSSLARPPQLARYLFSAPSLAAPTDDPAGAAVLSGRPSSQSYICGSLCGCCPRQAPQAQAPSACGSVQLWTPADGGRVDWSASQLSSPWMV